MRKQNTQCLYRFLSKLNFYDDLRLDLSAIVASKLEFLDGEVPQDGFDFFVRVLGEKKQLFDVIASAKGN